MSGKMRPNKSFDNVKSKYLDFYNKNQNMTQTEGFPNVERVQKSRTVNKIPNKSTVKPSISISLFENNLVKSDETSYENELADHGKQKIFSG